MIDIIIALVIYSPMILACVVPLLDAIDYYRASQRR